MVRFYRLGMLLNLNTAESTSCEPLQVYVTQA